MKPQTAMSGIMSLPLVAGMAGIAAEDLAYRSIALHSIAYLLMASVAVGGLPYLVFWGISIIVIHTLPLSRSHAYLVASPIVFVLVEAICISLWAIAVYAIGDIDSPFLLIPAGFALYIVTFSLVFGYAYVLVGYIIYSLFIIFDIVDVRDDHATTSAA